MLILIPVDSTDPKHARIVPRAQASQWALIDFDEGAVQSITFHDDRTHAGENRIDFAVLSSTFENYMDLMEEGMMVLCVREEKTIEDIIEAFKFKELDEVGF